LNGKYLKEFINPEWTPTQDNGGNASMRNVSKTTYNE